ncbi:MAG: alpha amylase C-terminal domain-containing protein [Bacteroidota bacterium]|nr:alpha amylase C-terminal domain-containing protein [Bacteroidota bacterium]
MSTANSKPALVVDDPWLEPYTQDIIDRQNRFYQAKKNIEQVSGSLHAFASVHKYLGINYDFKAKGWWYREWAPAAHALFFIGDFNNWNREANPLIKNDKGIWEIFLPDTDYKDKFTHQSLYKVHVVGDNGAHDRLPSLLKRAVQDEQTKVFTAQHWNPSTDFKWTDGNFQLNQREMPLIYEAHIGMAQEKEGVGTFIEFADLTLPRIKNLGYNVVQLMAIAEHPYYGSFGYHVSNYFAPSSRFGTPEDLKYLINKAHEMGIAIIMDIVHSHAVKNFDEGLNMFDGSDHQYFHAGGKGNHEQWDSKLFDYGKWEVKQFLLSNLTYWMEEFHFDGFRFDGVTSMLYYHHGNFQTFDHYDKYFKIEVDWDCITYLTLANDLIHTLKKGAITIAEDMSGMPGGCRTPEEGGIGFDYRLGMGIPDYWIKLLKHSRDEEWDIWQLYHTLMNRRYNEKTISYAESHDQALVGDKTIAFWLMDKEMYWHMQEDDQDLVIERGIALHKMIRLITMVLGGEGYMNFIGNEFGHPEWVDFPREGNGWSYKYARRQWKLVDDEKLKYKFLNNWDREMLSMASKFQLLHSWGAQQLNMDGNNKVIICERKNLIFIFNFSPNNSIFDYKFNVLQGGAYKIILNSDANMFGGHGRIDTNMEYIAVKDGDRYSLSMYLTNRTALVLEKIK